MIADRRQALAARLSQLEVDATLITFLPNVRYLTGFSGSNGQVVVGGAESVFFTDGRYTEQSRAEVPDIERVTYSDGFSASLLEQLKRLGVKRLGFEANNVTVAQLERFTLGLPEIELVPLGEEVERIRWIKDADEIEALNKAQSVTDQAFTDLLERFEAGMTERQAARDLMSLLMRDGADGLAFDSIVAFGENAAEPHHEPRERALDEGDVIKLDFGALYEGYHADMTRTVCFGRPADELRKIHDIVRRSQQAGIDAVKAGVTGAQVDAASRAVIEEAGYGETFTHSLGHGVGLEIHEGPRVSHASDDVLPAGTVVTIEPGIYVPGLGGVRIEDMVEVTEDGCRVIGTSSRELIEL